LVSNSTNIKLNEQQRVAVEHDRGPLLVIAGAGTGKTTVITERICRLISSGLCRPEEILALTFTEKASRQMEERVDERLPYGTPELWISTFHAFADRILRADGINIGINPEYVMLTQADATSLLRHHIHDLNLDYYRPLGNPNKFIQAMLTHFDRLRDEDIAPEEYARYVAKLPAGKNGEMKNENKKLQELSDAYRLYSEIKIRENVMDYADLIAGVLKLFRDRPDVLARYRRQFKYILVDEFQDTNFAQNELAVLLAHPANNLTVVGDDDQAIYRFRGAAVANILEFSKRFPKARTVVLTVNYRSTRAILDCSYKLIVQNNPDRLEIVEKIKKKLESGRGTAGKPVEFIYRDRVEDEAAQVAQTIFRLIDKREAENYAAITILVRANDHAEPFVRALLRLGIPYQFLGPGQLFRQSEIKDLLAYLAFLADPDNSVALYRILNQEIIGLPARDFALLMSYSRENGISLFRVVESVLDSPAADNPKLTPVGMARLTVFRKMFLRHLDLVKKETAGQILYYYLEDTGLLVKLASYQSLPEERSAQNIARFFAKLKAYEAGHEDASVYAVVDWINLSMELGESPLATETDWTRNNAVNIMTVHSAKGLEFPVVFVVNLVGGRFPTRNRSEKIPLPDPLIKEILPSGDPHLQEERRLFYVAMTRARDRLYLTAAAYYGEGKRENKISPFVLEALGPDMIKSINPQSERSFQLELLEWQKIIPVRSVDTKSEENQSMRISYSKLETFLTCPLQYKYRYLVALPVPSSAALTFGETIHRTLERFYGKIKLGETVGVGDLLSVYKQCFISRGYGNTKYKAKMYARGEKMLTDFYKIGHPEGKNVLDLERPFRVRIGNDIWVTGKIDRVDRLPGNRLEIIDYKTGQSPKAKNPLKDKQLTMYALAATDRSLYNVGPDRVVVSLYFLEDQTKVSATRTSEELDGFKSEIHKTVEGIRKSTFPPKPGMHCDFCEFRLVCDAWK
jgi:DNA helicase-2/ATP-dependent DNA helicase PcrA